MLIRHFIIPLITIVVLLSCNSPDTANKNEPVKATRVDTSKLERQRAFSELALKLYLKPLEEGLDSFEMRIWASSMLAEHSLVIIKHIDSSWLVQNIRYYRSEDGVIHYRNELLKPTISLSLLIDSIKQVRLAEIISQEEIPNFIDNVADGVTYDLEIATKNSYRLLTYHCPEHFAKTEPNNKKFLDVILLVDKFFRFWSPICSI